MNDHIEPRHCARGHLSDGHGRCEDCDTEDAHEQETST